MGTLAVYSLPPLAFFEITPVHKHTESLIMPLSVQLETPHSGKYEQPTGLFINNEFVKGAEGKTFEVINPSTEEVITSVHEATEKDIDIAVAAARKAFEGPWRKETPENRGKLIVKLANLFEENLDLLAAVESLVNGKAINMAKVDISMCVGCLRYYGGWADKIEGRVIDTNPDTFNYAKKEPIGVCAQIIPWNFPLLMWAWKIGPAIACGNTVVLKTAEQTPLGGLVAAKLIKEAGFQPGVVNIISGFGKIAGAALSSHGHRQGRLHWLHRRRSPDPQGCCLLQPQEGHSRARWQVPQHRLRGRRHRQRHLLGQLWYLLQPRPVLLRRLACLRAGEHLRQVRAEVQGARGQERRWRPVRCGHLPGPAGFQAPVRPHHGVHPGRQGRRCHRRDRWQAQGRQGLLHRAHHLLQRHRGHEDRAGGDLRPGLLDR